MPKSADTLHKLLAQFAAQDSILSARIAALAMFVAAMPGASAVPLDALKQSIASAETEGADAMRSAMQAEIDNLGRIAALVAAYQPTSRES